MHASHQTLCDQVTDIQYCFMDVNGDSFDVRLPENFSRRRVIEMNIPAPTVPGI